MLILELQKGSKGIPRLNQQGPNCRKVEEKKQVKMMNEGVDEDKESR